MAERVIWHFDGTQTVFCCVCWANSCNSDTASPVSITKIRQSRCTIERNEALGFKFDRIEPCKPGTPESFPSHHSPARIKIKALKKGDFFDSQNDLPDSVFSRRDLG